MQLTTGTAIDAEPEWSPDGDRVVFTSTRSGNVELWVMNSDHQPRQADEQPGGRHVAGWSPTGEDRLRQQPGRGNSDI